MPNLILIVTLLLAAATAAEPPRWPLDLESRYLTGNFLEPRGGRFHTGLDLKTNSRTGYAVLAAADGWVSRIKLTPNGYGKAVYLTCADGTTYVYGHLGRLADPLRQRVGREQARRGSYELDLHLRRGEVPWSRGEVLALSGQSGTSGPHLHFEVRGPGGKPHDPQAHGFAVPDTMAPEILLVRAVPLSGEAAGTSLIVGEGTDPLHGALPDLASRPGSWRFAALIIDRSDHLRYRLEPWRVSLLCDGRLVYRCSNDSLAWSRNRQQRIEFRRGPYGQERWLWFDPDRNTLAGRFLAATDAGAEGLTLVAGQRWQLVAEDRAGNRAAVSWRIAPDAGGWALDPEPLEPASPLIIDDPEKLTVSPPGRLPQWRSGTLRKPISGQTMLLSGLVEVGSPVEFLVPWEETIVPAFTAWPMVGSLAPELLTDPTVGVYRLARDRWTFDGPLVAEGTETGFVLDQPGTYALWRDQAAPVIATATVTTRLARRAAVQSHGITLPRWPVVVVPVGDHGSGVDWSRLAVHLDGQRIIAEPDPPRDRILVELPDRLAPGRHRLEIAAFDRAGHGARAALELDLATEPALDPQVEP